MIIEPKKTCESCHWRVSEFCNLLKLGVQKTTPACRGYRERSEPKEREAHVFSDNPSTVFHIPEVNLNTPPEFSKVEAKQTRIANRLFLKTLAERDVLNDEQIQKLSNLADSYLKESMSKGES